MRSRPLRRRANRLARLPLCLRTLQEAEVLTPGNVYEYLHPLLVGRVEEPCRRHMVNADGVDRACAHGGEIRADPVRSGEGITLRAGSKRSVGNGMDMESLRILREELAIYFDTVALTRKSAQVRCCANQASSSEGAKHGQIPGVLFFAASLACVLHLPCSSPP